MLEILAVAIILKGWHILITISVVTFVIMCILEAKEGGGYMYIPGYFIFWLFVNLLMWLIYFIIV